MNILSSLCTTVICYNPHCEIFHNWGEFMDEKIPRPVIRRLAIYYRLLKEYCESDKETISSSLMGKILGLKPSQIRKDLSYFGGFGKRGTGYSVVELMKSIEKILGVDRTWNVVIIGAGKIGRALVNYPGLLQDGFIIKAIVDNNEDKIGSLVSDKTKVENSQDLEIIIKERHIEIGVICVPNDQAQKVLEQLFFCKIRGVVNFAPTTLKVPKGIIIEDVHICLSFKELSFRMINESK